MIQIENEILVIGGSKNTQITEKCKVDEEEMKCTEQQPEIQHLFGESGVL